MDGSFFPNLMLTGAVINTTDSHFQRDSLFRHFCTVDCIEKFLTVHRVIITENLTDYGAKN